MPGQTNERAFESYVEEILMLRGGWKAGSNAYQGSTTPRFQEYRTASIIAAVTGKIDMRLLLRCARRRMPAGVSFSHEPRGH